VIHAHDWLVAYAAAGLQGDLGAPGGRDVHATEYGRHQGWLPGPMNKLIHQVEWWLTYEARRVIVCSSYMRSRSRTSSCCRPTSSTSCPTASAVRDFAVDPPRTRCRAASWSAPGPEW
jgi:glycogen synthase